jgi:hypothetical protein
MIKGASSPRGYVADYRFAGRYNVEEIKFSEGRKRWIGMQAKLKDVFRQVYQSCDIRRSFMCAYLSEHHWFPRRTLQVITCIGDSHARIFRYIAKADLLPGIRVQCLFVRGATALGLVNPRSKTNAVVVFKRFLERRPKTNVIVVMLGEVDCGYLLFYRAARYKVPLGEELERSVANYMEFVEWVKRSGFPHVVVCSVPPPTIEDGDPFLGDVIKARREYHGTLAERIQVTAEYNRLLKAGERRYGYRFLDLHTQLLDSETGIVMREFKNKHQHDNHLEEARVARLFSRAIQSLLKTLVLR